MSERVLILSDSPALKSGLARVTRELAHRFHRDHREVIVAGWHHFQNVDAPYPILGCDKGDPKSVGPIIAHVKPTHLIAIGDPWDFRWLAKAHGDHGGFRLIGYLNIEGAPIPPHHEVILDSFDVLTTTSQYGADIIGRKNVSAIHHGVDRKIFFPTDKPAEAFGRDLAKTFVVLLNAQNTQRKNLTAAIQAFGMFANGKDDVLMYANTQPTPMATEYPGVNLEDLIIELGLEHVIAFNPKNQGPHATSSDEEMNAIYGVADCMVMSSMGEGFGLALIESMATKTVPIAPSAYSANELLAEGRGELVPVAGTIRGPMGYDFVIVRPDHIAEALERVYRAWRFGELESYHEPGLAFAKTRTWGATYRALSDAMKQPRTRVADGRPIDVRLRSRARRPSDRESKVAVVKLGGLGDMLQTTVVVQAAAHKYDTQVTVVTNRSPEVFLAMPEVARVIECDSMPQDQVVRSIADEYPICMDVRYVSRCFGEPETEFFAKHRWYYDNWLASCGRLADLGMHTTEIMLKSLGLHDRSIQPIFGARMKLDVTDEFVAVCPASGILGELKQPPKEWWERLIVRLQSEGIKVVQIGHPQDMGLSVEDARDPDIRHQATVLSKAKVLIATEGGMVHLASAVGTPSVVMFGPTPVTLFGYKWNTNLTAEMCAPCWWGPGWEDQTCSRQVTSCVNFVPPDYAAVKALDLIQARQEATV